jgi:hypothetical protein
MNASELRLGNWVDPKFPMQVISIYKDEILCNFEGNEADPWDFAPKDLDGIPLTDEWLANFGFKKEGMHQLWMSVDFWVQETKVGFFYNGIEIKHVHQLQNLYFALTGKEL